MREFTQLGKKKAVIGMVHLGPMPGTPFYKADSYPAILARAVSDAEALHRGGADGCLVQTIDRVYPTGDEADPARIAGVAGIVQEIARATGPDFQIGVQILRNAISASLAVARLHGGTFLRCAALVGSTMTSDGLVQADPLGVMQYRRRLDAMHIKLIAEIHSMHFKSADGTPLVEMARAAVRAGADAVSLGDPDASVTFDLIRQIRAALPQTPIFLAGYTNHDNAARMLAVADGAYVGTCLEKDGWGGAIDEERVRAYVEIVRGLEQ